MLKADEPREDKLAVLDASVLIVGRDATFFRYYRDVVAGCEMKPAIAVLYEAGLSRLQRETYDLVIVHQGGPMFEGRCILECVRNSGVHSPVVVVSDRRDTQCCLAATRLGAVAYLAEPIQVPEIVRVISRVLRLRTLASQGPGAAWVPAPRRERLSSARRSEI